MHLGSILITDILIEVRAVGARIQQALINVNRHVVIVITMAVAGKPYPERASGLIVQNAKNCGRV